MAELAYQKQQAIEEYPILWKKIIREWSGSNVDSLWLTYSANYLLHTSGVKWAIDPYSIFSRIGGGEQPDFSNDLKPLQLVVLTHAHPDHLDPNIFSAIQHLPIIWVIPEFLLDRITETVKLDLDNIIVPKIGETLRIGDLHLTAFEGLHIHGENGVRALGYLAEFDNKRWLFPGDTRSYNFERLPTFGKLNGVFAHLWLGKGAALESHPPLLDDFCHFFSGFENTELIITHLREFGRQPEDFWDFHHYQLVRSHLRHINPNLKIIAALMGESIEL
jgi:hypothetical protein